MTPEAIVGELFGSRGLPREAMRAAGERRDVMVPVFLEIVETTATDPMEDLEGDDLFLLVFHLLGEWREPRAYRPLAKVLRRDPEVVEMLLGDGVTESAARVMAGVFDGDLTPLFEIIEDEAADEYVRGEMLETLAIVALEDPELRPKVSAFLGRFYDSAGWDVTGPIWFGWEGAIAALGLSAMAPLVRQAYEHDVIGPEWGVFAEFEERLNLTLQDPSAAWFRSEPKRRFVEDAVEELSEWHGFSEAYLKEQERAERSGGYLGSYSASTHVNEVRDVGRNDPCPCGSGKKFKKCCLQ
jgi:hypothetical protein